MTTSQNNLSLTLNLVDGSVSGTSAHVDPYPCGLLQFGNNQPLSGNGPQPLYAYSYCNNPDVLNSNAAPRLAVARSMSRTSSAFARFVHPAPRRALALTVADTATIITTCARAIITMTHVSTVSRAAFRSRYPGSTPGHLLLRAVAPGGAHYFDVFPNGQNRRLL